jgi:hypothetical protein
VCRTSSSGQIAAAERSSWTPSRQEASRRIVLDVLAASRRDRRAGVGLGDEPLPGGREGRHVGGRQPVRHGLLEPQRVRVGAGREARVREQQRQRVHQNSE